MCDRTGDPTSVGPIVAQGRVHQYTTGEGREYPIGFGETLKSAVASGEIVSLLEVFSGPNAPLAQAVSRIPW